MRKKVLFFAISKKELSGGQTMIYNALKHIDKANYDVELLVQSECPLSRKVEREGIKVNFLPFPNISLQKKRINSNWISIFISKILMVLTLLLFSIRTFQFVRKHEYEIVWCENIKVLLSVSLLKFSNVKLVFNMWSMVNSRLGIRLITLISNHIIVEGFFQKELFTSVKAPPITVIYTQIDKDIFKGSQINTRKETSKTIIGFLGGCRYSKGYDIFIEVAYNLVVRQGLTDLIFHVAGASQSDDLIDATDLRIKIDKLGDHIQINQWIEDKHFFYNEIDIFVSTSRSEGLPGAVREAMGFGLPVIATDVGGTQEALGETGLIITGNTREEIEKHCEQFIKHLVTYKRKSQILGSAAHKRANDLFIGYGWVKQLEKVFSKQ
ncbi:glycosyltransferase family 4 protein [Alkalihalobacillus hwajinpoensis]|uniref:glycosyltransferase family 4 protein n=1 Tax=Guptibacillus hwajinpoensis TaxID=208199 RepID=UPI001884143E|nr:glycosyltransferase family 4 protein [Pseudalkalibacillus hwajinpoensis]MBF0705385.1 glycosyltransferase family 4 protein [Pseudalkalibacillus hwajinpoensis]